MSNEWSLSDLCSWILISSSGHVSNKQQNRQLSRCIVGDVGNSQMCVQQ